MKVPIVSRIEPAELVATEPVELIVYKRTDSGSAVSMLEILNSWKADKKENTLRAYENDLEDFAAFLKLSGAQEAIKAEAIKALIDAGGVRADKMCADYCKDMLENRKLRAATIERRLNAIKSVISLVRRFHIITWKIQYKGPKRRKRTAAQPHLAGPSDDSVNTIIQYFQKEISSTSNSAEALHLYRDYTMIMLMMACMRRMEVTGLDVEHVNLELGGVNLLGKGSDEREFQVMPVSTMSILKTWVELRKLAFSDPNYKPLFMALDPHAYGARLSESGLYYVVKNIEKVTGLQSLGKLLRPHGFRHKGVTTILTETKDVTLGAAMARHADISTTMIYDDNLKNKPKTASQALDKYTLRSFAEWREKTGATEYDFAPKPKVSITPRNNK